MFILFIKGFFVGLGKIIPGVSGSVLAMTLGIYDKLLNIISSFYKNIKENIKFVFPIALGIFISITLGSNIIFFLLNNYFVITIMFFIGLIIGGVPNLLRKTNFKSYKNIVIFLISFMIIISTSFVSSNKISNNYSFIEMFLIGIVEAISMIVPGLSGTAIMMMLGCYNTVLVMFSNVFSNINILIPFLIGALTGIIILSKIVAYFLKNYEKETYSSVLGFLIASILILIGESIAKITDMKSIFIGIFLLFVGTFLSKLLDK